MPLFRICRKVHKSPNIYTVRPTIPSAFDRASTKFQGRNEYSNVSVKATLIFLYIPYASKKKGMIESAPTIAIPKREPNPFMPNIYVPRAEIYIGKTGG